MFFRGTFRPRRQEFLQGKYRANAGEESRQSPPANAVENQQYPDKKTVNPGERRRPPPKENQI
jgi:hypothetical protein